MPRYKLTIEYDGTDFAGWQKQEPFTPEGAAPVVSTERSRAGPEEWVQGVVQRAGESRPRQQLRTVQHMVERAIREIVRERVMLVGASRTDSGVHARGQVGAFSCSPQDAPGLEASRPEPMDPGGRSGWPEERGLDRLRRAINGRLPDDVQVLGVERVAHDFNPIADCTGKGYSYTLYASPAPPRGSGLRPLWDRRYVHHVWGALDVAAMRAAAAYMVGEHDFAAFAAAGHGRLSTVRTIYACHVAELRPDGRDGSPVPDAERIRIDVSGSGFLYNMVRIIAGTLVEVGLGRTPPEGVRSIIEGKDRTRAGPTLPPTGLCLEWVGYGDRR